MGRQEDRAAARLEVQDDVLDLARVDRVQARGRFVEEQQLGVVDQRPREGQPHLHSLGVLANSRVGVIGQPHRVEQRQRVRRVAGVERREEAQVLEAGELLIVIRQLEGDTDALVVVGSPGQRVLPPHRGLAAVTSQQADQELLRGGLPGAAGTEKPEDLAAPTVKSMPRTAGSAAFG